MQFVLLARAWSMTEHGDVPHQLRLAGQAGTDVKMTSQVLRRLEAERPLVREIDPAYTRARRLRLTPAGTRLATRALAAVEAVEAVDAEFFAGDERPQPGC